MRQDTLILPGYWASYLVNGDASGLDDDDVELIDSVIAHAFPECHATCVDVLDDNGFTHWHDAVTYGVKGADCATYTFHIV